MTERAGARDQLRLASEACGHALTQAPLAQVVKRLGAYADPAAAFQLLSQVTAQGGEGPVQALRNSIASNADDTEVERALLLLASQHAVTQVPALPVAERVKELFADEFVFWANPTPAWIPKFRFDDVRFREMARLATLRRFPAGQFHWEITGLPRSWVFQSPQTLKLLWHVLGRMGGLSPLFEFHLNPRRKGGVMLLEKQANISYFRTAKSIEKQPAIKGLMLASWLYSESTAEVSPHLAWLRTVPQSGGALAVDLGPAPEDSGFLVGGGDRRKKYQEGTYRPTIGCVLWARQDLIAWAKQHPEFDE